MSDIDILTRRVATDRSETLIAIDWRVSRVQFHSFLIYRTYNRLVTQPTTLSAFHIKHVQELSHPQIGYDVSIELQRSFFHHPSAQGMRISATNLRLRRMRSLYSRSYTSPISSLICLFHTSKSRDSLLPALRPRRFHLFQF